MTAKGQDYSDRSEIWDLINRVDSLYEETQYDSAYEIGKLALREYESRIDQPDTTMARILIELGKCNRRLGQYSEAEQNIKQALHIYQELLDPEHPDLARCMLDLGATYLHQGRYKKAEPILKRTSLIMEEELGPEHPDLATCILCLGILYAQQGKYREAEMFSKRALNIFEKSLGMEHPEVAKALNSLAGLYYYLGKFNDAGLLTERTLSIWEKTLGPEHPSVAVATRNLANVYLRQGKYTDAELLCRRSLDIEEHIFGPDHSSTVAVCMVLGSLYRDQGKYARAESLYVRSIDIHEKTEGSDNPFFAWCLSEMAGLYHRQHRYAQAETLYNRSLAIRINKLGPGHPKVSENLNGLGIIYQNQGRYAEALSLHKRALTIKEDVFGSKHPDVQKIMRDIAKTYCSIGDFEEGRDYFRRAQEYQQTFIDYAFSASSENLKMSYIRQYPLIDNSFISLALEDNTGRSNTPAIEMVLKGKGAVLDAVSAEKEIAYCSTDSVFLDLAKQFSDISEDIASLVLNGSKQMEPENYRQYLQELNRIRDSLETELSRNCAEYNDKSANRDFTVDDVAKAIPDGSTLWEFLLYEPYGFGKVGSDEEKTGPERYLVFTLDRSGEITINDLGSATEIDSLIALSRRMVYEAKTDVYSGEKGEAERKLNEVTCKLYDIIFAPLESPLGANTNIIISPDGQLNLLPFEILPDHNGKYVIERYAISYLSTGRDLLKYKKEKEYGNRALVMANPYFSLPEDLHVQKKNNAIGTSKNLLYAYEPSREASSCLDTGFRPLPFTQKEGKSVAKILKTNTEYNIEFYYGTDALEEVLKGITSSPRILHLATHGYFCEDINIQENIMLENPLLRSGLVFAGANQVADESERNALKTEDGILTAFEASGLNLTATELVVLSACETGVGEIRNGEGVYGLRRAFQSAGAKSILMSLWKIPDRETSELMKLFYEGWLEGNSKRDALRQASLKVLDNRRESHRSAHPYFWGAFVLLGDML